MNHNMDLPSLGREGVRYCDRLFRIEERLENVDPEERLRVRRKESLPIVEEFYTWLEARDPAYKGQKEAITYARNQKAELMRFLDDGRILISNNAAENAIRPFVIGRKNWLFCKSNDGAVAAADAYSLVETAKANGLDVMKYLNYVFRRISIPGAKHVIQHTKARRKPLPMPESRKQSSCVFWMMVAFLSPITPPKTRSDRL